jgi:PBSX family phage portal protein
MPVKVKNAPAKHVVVQKREMPRVTAIEIKKWMGDPDPPPAKSPGKGSKAGPVIQNGILTSVGLDREVVFGSLYTQEGMSGAIKPPYDPDRLSQLCEENNALQPCIDAFITNVDGTGHEVVSDEDAQQDIGDDVLDRLRRFFDQPWPGQSFMSMRRRLRRDLETTGNGYIEVLRNGLGQLALLRRLDPCITRIMRLGKETFVQRIWSPALNDYVEVQVRRRRYVQYVFGKLVYFKEFGSPMALSRVNGKWEDTIDVPPEEVASEVIHLVCVPHWQVPYGIPRWVPQTPSVLGSRRAEEFNLGFFDQGGIPPLMIVVQGGEVAEDVEKAIKNLFYSAGPQKTTAAVLQVQSAGGTLDDPSQVRVTVERFGNDRQKDQLFQQYDENCEAKVRRSWRIPRLFTGSTQEMNYATALAAYRVAEAQVFKPERDHFDEIITTTIVKDLVGEDLAPLVKFRSLPITARDMDLQLKALQMATPNIAPEELLDNLNEISGLQMEPMTPEERLANAQQQGAEATAKNPTGAPGAGGGGATSGAGVSGGGRGADIENDVPANKRDQRKRFVRKGTRVRYVQSEVLGGETALDLIRGGDTAKKAALDSVEYLSRNPRERDSFSRSVMKRLFATKPNEERGAARLAEVVVAATALEGRLP